MALVAPYGQHHYMGEYASDALALAFIQANNWDTNGDGTGNPQIGMLYYNTQLNKMKLWNATTWRVLEIGNDMQESVIDFYDPSGGLPVGPAVGDRYISTATASGWTIDYIYEWDGAIWMETIPTEGTMVEVEALDNVYIYNGAAWVLLPSLFFHNTLAGIQGGAAADYFHLLQTQHDTLTDGSNADALHAHSHNNLQGIQGGSPGDYFHLTAAELLTLETDRWIFDWLLYNGATPDTLNSGKISTTRLPKSATDPGIQFKVDLKRYDSSKDVIIQVVAGHSTLTQTLDVDLDYVEVAPGENFNTEAGGATVNATPVTPGTAYERFVFTFTIPAASITENGSLECQLTRDNSGADTGDLHIWEIRAYQV